MSSAEWLAWAALATTWATPVVRRWDRWVRGRRESRAMYWHNVANADEVGEDYASWAGPPPYDWWLPRWQRRER